MINLENSVNTTGKCSMGNGYIIQKYVPLVTTGKKGRRERHIEFTVEDRRLGKQITVEMQEGKSTTAYGWNGGGGDGGVRGEIRIRNKKINLP